MFGCVYLDVLLRWRAERRDCLV